LHDLSLVDKFINICIILKAFTWEEVIIVKKHVLLAIVALSLLAHWTVGAILINSSGQTSIKSVSAAIYFGSLVVGFVAATRLWNIGHKERYGVPMLKLWHGF
jgi:hypothetical protein